MIVKLYLDFILLILTLKCFLYRNFAVSEKLLSIHYEAEKELNSLLNILINANSIVTRIVLKDISTRSNSMTKLSINFLPMKPMTIMSNRYNNCVCYSFLIHTHTQ